jgi:hypothetical protein
MNLNLLISIRNRVLDPGLKARFSELRLVLWTSTRVEVIWDGLIRVESQLI